ncbi:hypothetical protein BGW39_004635 [Mortierella sp. 14UC]|nr:hypothetical protein BGW39_004635 [Mortierella sp. 14UC]
MSTHRRALELPEILIQVGRFLPKASLCACLRVCASFHTALSPLLYQQAIHPPTSTGAPESSIANYAHSVRDLNLHSGSSIDLMSKGFTNLHCFYFRALESLWGVELDDTLSNIVLNNPGLKRFTLDIFGANITSKFWKTLFQARGGLDENGAVVGEAPGLTTGLKLRYMDSLVFSRLTINSESYPWFVRVCALTHRLDLENIRFTPAEPEKDIPFDIGQYLPPTPLPCVFVRFRSSGQPLCDQVEFLSRCTNAREIRFPSFQWHECPANDSHRRMNSITLESWRNTVKKHTWPHLQDIILGKQDMRNMDVDMDTTTDKAISHALDSIHCSQLTSFNGFASGVGLKTVLSLRPQHLSLLSLTLLDCPGVPSSGIQLILECFPRLVELEVDQLNIHDIRMGQPWVCTSLKTLSVKVVITCKEFEQEPAGTNATLAIEGGEGLTAEEKALKDHRLVFERLSALSSLERLTLPRHMRADDEAISDGLELRLAFGLNCLTTLTRLEYVDIGASSTGLEMEDVEWMVFNWPRLECLRASLLHPDEDKNDELEGYLLERGIDIPYSYSWY